MFCCSLDCRPLTRIADSFHSIKTLPSHSPAWLEAAIATAAHLPHTAPPCRRSTCTLALARRRSHPSRPRSRLRTRRRTTCSRGSTDTSSRDTSRTCSQRTHATAVGAHGRPSSHWVEMSQQRRARSASARVGKLEARSSPPLCALHLRCTARLLCQSRPHGEGEYVFQNGTVYTGTFSEGMSVAIRGCCFPVASLHLRPRKNIRQLSDRRAKLSSLRLSWRSRLLFLCACPRHHRCHHALRLQV